MMKVPNEVKHLVSKEPLSLAVRDMPPGKNFVRLNGERADGLPDGFHTGGAWLSPKGQVWKPLDARPYSNCPYHYPTLEHAALEHMADRPGFPRNWRVETVECGGLTRRFLVRRKSFVVGRDYETRWLDLEQVLEVERAVRGFNARGWEINDAVTVAVDPVGYDLFVLDLSACCWRGPEAQGCYRADETGRVETWLREIGFTRLADLRCAGRRVLPSLLSKGEWPGREWRHVYASRNRPMSPVWANVPQAHYVDGEYGRDGVWTWIVTPAPLGDDVVQRYELTWAWSPIVYKWE